MTNMPKQIGDKIVLNYEHLQSLFNSLINRNFKIIGPTVVDNAIVYGELSLVNELPVGYTDEQEGGTYRIKKRNDRAAFGYNVGPHSWKKYLHPPVKKLWQGKRKGTGFEIVEEQEVANKYAFIGVRSCEIHAMSIQDRVFTGGQFIDNAYKSNRENSFVVAVNCGQAASTCFCDSMNTGPKVEFGFDLSLTEIIKPRGHYFVVEVGTQEALEVINEIPNEYASEKDMEAADSIVDNTRGQMGREIDTSDIKELLYRNYENPRWDEVADRCLSCANCTMVCPTCFCTTVEDTTDLTGDNTERVQKWDSCFTMDFSHIHGGSVRTSVKSRYRQWITHKLATWIDQFGTSGCVGCGRCITWCPVGIDITEEIDAIRKTEKEE